MTRAGPHEVGRRQRKVRETRAALVRAAIDLFESQGFDATSVEQIADRVDVSARTFHRYFPAKEDVLFADVADRHQAFGAILRARPADEPLLTSLREAAIEHAANMARRPEHEERRLRIIEGNPTLDARNVVIADEWGEGVVEYAAARLGLDPNDLLPRLLGTIVSHAMRAARQRWTAGGSLDFAAEVEAAFDLVTNLEDAVDGAERERAARRRRAD